MQCMTEVDCNILFTLTQFKLGFFENLGGPSGSEELPHYLIYMGIRNW